MSNPDFIPEFGPNGAVMNAPTMTPEMRAEIERSSRPPTAKELRGALGQPLVIAIFAILIARNGGSVLEFLKSSPWWAGAFAGGVAVVAAIVIWRAIGFNLKRWELMLAGSIDRSLDVPGWCRWSLAAADTFAVSAYTVAIAWFLADIDRVYPMVWWTIGFAAGNAATVSLGLRWYASRRGWNWRTKTA